MIVLQVYQYYKFVSNNKQKKVRILVTISIFKLYLCFAVLKISKVLSEEK